MKTPLIALLLALSLTGCAQMEEKTCPIEVEVALLGCKLKPGIDSGKLAEQWCRIQATNTREQQAKAWDDLRVQAAVCRQEGKQP